MLTITDGGSLARALSSSLNDSVKRLLARRCRQLGGDIKGEARFVVAQPGDDLTTINEALGFEVTLNTVDGTRFGERGYAGLPEASFLMKVAREFDRLAVQRGAGIPRAQANNIRN